jgi:hypothetical protein
MDQQLSLVRFHEGAKNSVHAAQMPAALSPEPFQHVGIEAQMNRRLVERRHHHPRITPEILVRGMSGRGRRVRVLPSSRSALRLSVECCLVSSLAVIVHPPCADDPPGLTTPSEGDHEAVVTDTSQCAIARLTIVAALVLGFEQDALENQGGIREVHTVIFKIADPFWVIPLDAHRYKYTNVDTKASVKTETCRSGSDLGQRIAADCHFCSDYAEGKAPLTVRRSLDLASDSATGTAARPFPRPQRRSH